MNWINTYLAHAVYVDGGRGPLEFDCWGLTRHVRAEHLGLRLLPSHGDLRNTDPRQFTRAYRDESSVMEECAPEHGAIAAVLHGAICVHVGLVIDHGSQLRVLEINPSRGPRFIPLSQWRRDHSTVTFHRDKP